MSCDLKTSYRPDKRLQKKLVSLAYSLIILSLLVIIFFLFPKYFVYWAILGVLLILNSIFLAVQALEAGENAIMYGGFANEVIATDNKIKRIDDVSGNSVIYNAKSAELFGDNNVIDFLENKIANDEVNKNALQRLKKAAERFICETVDIAIEQSKEQFTSLKNVEYYRISVRPIFLKQVDFFQSPLILRKIKRDSFLLWSAENITAIKNIEQILNQERKDLHDFLDYLPVGLYVLDDNQKIDYVNLRFAEWIGKSREEIIGKSFIDLLVINSNQPIMRKEWMGEVYFKDSDKFFSAFVAHSLYDDEGEIKTRAVVIRDVANAKEIKEELVKASDKIDWLFNKSPVGIVNVNHDGKIIECNDIFESYFNQKKEDLLNKNIKILIKQDDQNLLIEKLNSVYDKKEISSRIDVHLNSENELDDKVATIYISPMCKKLSVDDENCDGLILHFIDATKQKSLELQFAQAQKMQAMGQLAGGIAHDFNNLLTAMIGFCDLLLQRHGIGDPSFADLIQIKNNANRAAGLVRQLLAFSRKQSLKPKLIDVTENFAELTHMLKRVIGERVELKYQHGNDLGFIRVDPVQFSQVILNLAVNARDAMENSGVLTIRTYCEALKNEVEFGGDIIKPGEFLVVEVTDTGCGISEENLTRIFEPFFSTKQNVVGSGTGLGLATVYGIVRQTGGYIIVDSKLGEGTTFSIHLPRFETDEDAKALESEIKNDEVISNNKGATILSVKEKFAVSTGGSKEQLTFGLNVNAFTRISETSSADGIIRVLFVEDEDSVRAFGIRALKKKGYEVIGCNSAENAIEQLEEDKNFNLLITDMVMPGKNGAELAKYVKEQIPNIKIILMSGYSEDIAKNELAVSDDYEFMAKPFSLGSLIAKVQEVL